MSPRAAPLTRSPGELASDLKALGINLRDLQIRIETAADLEPLALTDERLQEIEAVRAAIASLEDVITRARNRSVARAVAARWPYKRIQRATGLSISRIGQIAPARDVSPDRARAGMEQSDDGQSWRTRDGRDSPEPRVAVTDALVAIAEDDLAAEFTERETE